MNRPVALIKLIAAATLARLLLRYMIHQSVANSRYHPHPPSMHVALRVMLEGSGLINCRFGSGRSSTYAWVAVAASTPPSHAPNGNNGEVAHAHICCSRISAYPWFTRTVTNLTMRTIYIFCILTYPKNL
jgi:hypothetical protein